MPHGRDGRPFRSPSEVAAIGAIRNRCTEVGADFDLIWRLAQLAFPWPKRLPRKIKATLHRLDRDLPVLIKWMGNLTETVALEFTHRKVRLALQGDEEAVQVSPRQLRAAWPKGYAKLNVIIATMAQEFRRHFHRPCYEYILTLMAEVRPDDFFDNPGTRESAVEAIRQRIKRVPVGQVEEFRRRLAEIPLPSHPVRRPRKVSEPSLPFSRPDKNPR